MAATFSVSVSAELLDLGEPVRFHDKGTDGTTPTAGSYMYRTIATTNTAEALDLGDVSTVTCIVLRAISGDIDIDCDFSSSFDADMTAKAGEIPVVISNPAGTVYVKNGTADETPTFEYVLSGTT